MRPTAAVVGAGVAGMCAATHLSLAGFQVTLLDKAPQPGGRALSFQEPVTGDWIDNGPHLLMGCYRETLRLLDALGTRNRLLSLPLRVVWLSAEGRRHTLQSIASLGRAGLLWGLLRLDSLEWKDRWAVVRAIQSAGRLSDTQLADLHRITCLEWLQSLRQTPRAIARFWEPLLVAALNEKAHLAAADGLAVVVREALLGGAEASRLLIPRTCLRDLFQPSLIELIQHSRGTVRLRTPVRRILIDRRRVAGIETHSGERIQADGYVLALSPRALSAVLPENEPAAADLRRATESPIYSPIISLYVWLREPLLAEPMVGLLDSPLHWVFQRLLESRAGEARHLLAIPLSAADAWAGVSSKELQKMVTDELGRFLPNLNTSAITLWRVIRERRATVSFRPAAAGSRPGIETPWPNLFLAGDWTATGLPATIESAARSGRACAERIIERRQA